MSSAMSFLFRSDLRHVAVHDPDGEALGDGGLADARVADEDGVVLRAAAQHLHRAADFLVAPDDRVDLAGTRRFRQVAGVFVERVIAFFGGRGVGGAPLAEVVDRGVELLGGDRARIQRVLGARFHHGERHEDAFDGNEAVARLLRDLLRLVEHLRGLLVEIGLPGVARHLGDPPDGAVQRLGHAFGRSARAADEVGGQPLLVVHEGLQEVFGQEPLVAFPHRDGLCGLKEPARPFRELLQVHRLLLP
jgi:hypothetical protein